MAFRIIGEPFLADQEIDVFSPIVHPGFQYLKFRVCELPTQGACCLPDGSCELSTQGDCVMQNGTFYLNRNCGPPSPCDQGGFNCCVPIGGGEYHCVPDVPLCDCIDMNGTPLIGPPNEAFPCDDSEFNRCNRTGACVPCDASSCSFVREAECNTVTGQLRFWGQTSCQTVESFPDSFVFGACTLTLTDGTCICYNWLQPFECEQLGNAVWQPNYIGDCIMCQENAPAYEPTTCPPATVGACCIGSALPGTQCENGLSPEQCTLSGGAWLPGLQCVGPLFDDCPAGIGACCLNDPDNCCVDTDGPNCDLLGGFWLGLGTSCLQCDTCFP